MVLILLCYSDVAIWSVMEPSLGIIAGCAATLRPLFKAWGFGPKSRLRDRHSYHSQSRSGRNGGWPSSQSQHLQKMSKSTSGSRTVRRDELDDARSDIELTGGSTRSGRADGGSEGTEPQGKVEVHGFDVLSRPKRPGRTHSPSERTASWQGKQLPAVPSVPA